MNLYPIGDYYSWYCNWCDSLNMTFWAHVEGKVTCGACHRQNAATDLVEDERYGNSRRRILLEKLAARPDEYQNM